MKIYTSYWAQVRNFPTTLIGLNTTIFPPRWHPLGQDNRGVWVIDCPPLKPGHNCDGLCNGKCAPKHPQDCKFLYEYKRQLDAIDFDRFFQKLQKLHDSISEDMNKDIDFAFKLHKNHYKSIFNPFALLFHHESATRVEDEDEKNRLNYENIMYFYNKWGDYLFKEIFIDKYYNTEDKTQKKYPSYYKNQLKIQYIN